MRAGKVQWALAGHDGPHTGLALAVSDDGSLLATGGHRDYTVRVWETLTGQEILRLGAHRGPVLAMTFSRNGGTLASAGADTTVLVWDLLALPQERPAGIGQVGRSTPEQCWEKLSSADARDAYEARRQLIQLSERSIALLRERLRPVSQRPKSIEQILKELDDDEFTVREAAMQELCRRGPSVQPGIERALANGPSAEVRRRLEAVLERLQVPAADFDVIRQRRAVQVLEQIGTEEAIRLLRVLAEGQETAEQTRAARASLGRLRGRPVPR